MPTDGRTRAGPDGLVFRAGRGLTAQERAGLECDRDEIADLLEPADHSAIGGIVEELLQAMSQSERSDEAFAATRNAYQEALEGVPLFALVEARRVFYRGKAMVDGRRLDKRFPPSPPELATLADQQAFPWRRQLALLAGLLAAPEEKPDPRDDPEIRARRAERVARLVRSIAAGAGLSPTGGRADPSPGERSGV